MSYNTEQECRDRFGGPVCGDCGSRWDKCECQPYTPVLVSPAPGETEDYVLYFCSDACRSREVENNPQLRDWSEDEQEALFEGFCYRCMRRLPHNAASD